MHGPPLSRRESAAAVAIQVERLEALDIDRASAIRAVARQHDLNPIAVDWAAQEHASNQTEER
jgi:hypothetical protein